MDRKAILEELLSLSNRHLVLLREEDWEAWEATTALKKKLYSQLMAAAKGREVPEEEKLVAAIRELEETATKELEEKREMVKKELREVLGGEKGVHGYGRTARKSSRGHLNIKC
jgi:hypothetical protein